MATAKTYTDSDQGNFFCMSILTVDYTLKVLQDVLQKELETKYPNLFDPSTGLLNGVLGDSTVKTVLFRLSPKIFNRHQREQLYPAENTSLLVTVGDLDLTLTLLLLRNITSLNPHAQLNAWDDPFDTDTSREATIGRIKRYQNIVYGYANKAAISDQDFRAYFSGLKSSLLVLSSRFTNEDYDAILSEPLDADLLRKYRVILEEWNDYDKDVKDTMGAGFKRISEGITHLIDGPTELKKLCLGQDQHEENTKGAKLKSMKPDTCYQAPVMSPTHKSLSMEMRHILRENLRIKDIIQDMVDKNIFSKDNAEKVMAKETMESQANEFLCILPKCGPRAFETFIEVLRKHNKKELADSLAKKATACSSKSQIANFYIDHMSQIQRLPWDPDDTMHLDDVCVNLQLVEEERKPTGTSSNQIQSYTSILGTKQDKKPKRILVRGKAGIGKTTLTQKMATDWANATLGLGECDGLLSKYKHLLILNLRSIQPGQTLMEAIEKQIFPLKQNEKEVVDEIMHALDYDSDHVLLVFDGCDEYDFKTSKEITDIIHRRRYQEVCTIITTRPWKAEELMKKQLPDSVYEITGLTGDDIREYVAKFFNENMDPLDWICLEEHKSIAKGLVDYIKRRKLKSLVKIPILLLFICIMWQEDQESDAQTDSLPASYTLLYKKLLQLLLRRRFDIRTQDEMEEHFEQTFISLGKLSYDGLVKSDGGLIFNETALQGIPHIYELYSLGLLRKSKVTCNIEDKHEVTFLHKTIQEFFAAKYLAGALDKNDSSILDQLLDNLATVDKLYDMSFVLRFLCGLSRKATAKVLGRAKYLQSEFIKQNFEAISMNHELFSRHSQWFNNLLLEHWYAHCPQETVLPPELISCLTELCIPGSFQHSDPKFQQVLYDSMCSSQVHVYSSLKAVVFGSVIYEITHKLLSLLRKCVMFGELVAVFWLNVYHICDDCTCALNHVLSKAPNLQQLRIDTPCSGALSSIANPGKLLHLAVECINDQDCQVILQMGHLKIIWIINMCGMSRDPVPVLGTLPNTSNDLTYIDISLTPLRAVGVQLLGRNLRHVPGLEHLELDWMFPSRPDCRPECGPSRCTCPISEDTTDYDRCQDVCEAVRELSQGVIHTTKLKHFSFNYNNLGRYHGITIPLIALIQSLSRPTVSQQTGMEIYMYSNELGRVDRLSELIEAVVNSYQHVSSWDLRDNDLEKSLPKPDDSLNCKVEVHTNVESYSDDSM